MADGEAIEKHVIGDRVNDLILLARRGRASYLLAADHGLHRYHAAWQRTGTRPGVYVGPALLDADPGTCVAVTEDGEWRYCGSRCSRRSSEERVWQIGSITRSPAAEGVRIRWPAGTPAQAAMLAIDLLYIAPRCIIL